MRFSTTETLELEKTSALEQGTTSKCPFTQLKTRLTFRNSEYLAILDEMSNSTKSPLAYCNYCTTVEYKKQHAIQIYVNFGCLEETIYIINI